MRKAVDSAWPEPRKPLPPLPSALDPYKAVIDGILPADLDAPSKQRHRVTWIFHRLVAVHRVFASAGQNSVAIASNESFGGWTKTFTDPRHCPAIVDRLTFNDTIIETGTDSYRLASTRARAGEPAKAG